MTDERTTDRDTPAEMDPAALIPAPDAPASGPRLRMFGRTLPLPRNVVLRVGLGVLLVIGGMLGFLPILGFWMIPLGLLVLSMDIPMIRRWRRRATVWLLRRYPRLTPYLAGRRA